MGGGEIFALWYRIEKQSLSHWTIRISQQNITMVEDLVNM